MLMIIETPEGEEFMADAVVGLALWYESEDYISDVKGTQVLLSSGHTMYTVETMERVRAQIVECFVKAAEGASNDQET